MGYLTALYMAGVDAASAFSSRDFFFLQPYVCPEAVFESSEPIEYEEWARLLSVGRCKAFKTCDDDIPGLGAKNRVKGPTFGRYDPKTIRAVRNDLGSGKTRVQFPPDDASTLAFFFSDKYIILRR